MNGDGEEGGISNEGGEGEREREVVANVRRRVGDDGKLEDGASSGQ